jgi:hypothetical protein
MPCNHDLENAVPNGRAYWLCPLCGADVSLIYVLYAEAVMRSEDIKEEAKWLK